MGVMPNTTLLITGAAGFIGFHLSKSLLNQGYHIAGVDNLNDYYDMSLKHQRLNILKKYPNFSFFHTDITNADQLRHIFSTKNPVAVVHLAAQAGVRHSLSHPDEYIHSNLIGFYTVLAACKEHKVQHFVFASSSSVYGSNTKVPYAPHDKTDSPVSLYAATKKSNELLAYSYSHLYGIPTTGVRFFTVYGPYGRPDMAYFSFTKNILTEKPLTIFNNGDVLRDFTYIDDAVTAVELLLQNPPEPTKTSPPFRIVNVGASAPVSVLEFISLLERHLGKTATKVFLPMQPGDVYQTYADITFLEKEFGYSPQTKLSDGLKKFTDWYQNEYQK